MLLWDAGGQMRVGYRAPVELAAGYGVAGHKEILRRMGALLEAPLAESTAPRTPAYRDSRRAPRLITPRRAPNDIIDPSEAAEPIESTEASDPIDPIESTDPTEPIDSTEPREPIDSSEFSDQSDHFEADTGRQLAIRASSIETRRNQAIDER